MFRCYTTHACAQRKTAAAGGHEFCARAHGAAAAASGAGKTGCFTFGCCCARARMCVGVNHRGGSCARVRVVCVSFARPVKNRHNAAPTAFIVIVREAGGVGRPQERRRRGQRNALLAPMQNGLFVRVER